MAKMLFCAMPGGNQLINYSCHCCLVQLIMCTCTYCVTNNLFGWLSRLVCTHITQLTYSKLFLELLHSRGAQPLQYFEQGLQPPLSPWFQRPMQCKLLEDLMTFDTYQAWAQLQEFNYGGRAQNWGRVPRVSAAFLKRSQNRTKSFCSRRER